jgi:hypothetical protein
MPTVACMSRRHALAVVPLVVLVAALVGCSGATRIPPPEPSSAVEPLFASDEEALEAATQAYEEYLLASNVVTASQDLSVESIEELVTAEYFELFVESVEGLRSQGLRTTGSSRILSTELQQWYEEDDMASVIVYLCLDVSGVRVVDELNVDMTPADRATIVALEVGFEESDQVRSKLLVASSDAWSEGDLCGTP